MSHTTLYYATDDVSSIRDSVSVGDDGETTYEETHTTYYAAVLRCGYSSTNNTGAGPSIRSLDTFAKFERVEFNYMIFIF